MELYGLLKYLESKSNLALHPITLVTLHGAAKLRNTSAFHLQSLTLCQLLKLAICSKQ